MTSVIHSVTSWLGGSRERDRTPPGENERITQKEIRSDDTGSGDEPVEPESNVNAPTTPVEGDTSSSGPSTGISIDVNLQDVSEKAVTAAKEWGSKCW